MRTEPASPVRALTPAALGDQVTPGQVALRAGVAVYTVRHVVDGDERTDLWTVPVRADGGAATPSALTDGPGTDHTPRISPDGSLVAFVRERGAVPGQVHVLRFDERQPRPVTTFARGVLDLDWTPDGAALIVLAEDDRSAQVHRAAGVPDGEAPTAWLPQRADWRADGAAEGGLQWYPRHLHRVDPAVGRSRRLTTGDWSAARPRADADGGVCFVADSVAGDGVFPVPQVYRLTERDAPVSDLGQAAQLTGFAGGVVRFHLHGKGVRVLANDEPGRPDHVPARWFDVTADGTVPLAPGADRWVGLLGDETDLHDWRLELDDAATLTTASHGGCTVPVRSDGGTPLVHAPAICGAVAAEGDDAVAVLCFADGRYGPDLYAIGDGTPRRLTTHGNWLAGYPAPNASRHELAGPAGPISVHVLQPPAGVPARGTVLALHGGPTGQWGVVPTVEALLLAAAGYTVAMPNIRGSIDRGPDWVRALGGAWGAADAHDAVAVCAGLAALGLGPARGLGVSGLSYGGFLTLWLIGTSDLFAAAVSENGVANQVSAWANCDTGPAFCRSAALGDPLTPAGVERLWHTSPLRNVASVHTPLLMLQGADDRICPAADNEQFFLALRALGRSVSYVLYPEESHLMQATARLDRRIDRHERVLAWFDQHLAR